MPLGAGIVVVGMKAARGHGSDRFDVNLQLRIAAIRARPWPHQPTDPCLIAIFAWHVSRKEAKGAAFRLEQAHHLETSLDGVIGHGGPIGRDNGNHLLGVTLKVSLHH